MDTIDVLATASFTCAARLDTDAFAERFVDAVPEVFTGETRVMRSVRERHAMIDAVVERALGEDPGLTVVVVGAGFDSRAFRMGGGRWLEVDREEVLAFKEGRLPLAECPNPLVRAPSVEAAETVEGEVLVVLEGVLMYLAEKEARGLLGGLREAFPGHRLVCDLMPSSFARRYSASFANAAGKVGAPFSMVEDPRAVVEGCGYLPVEREPIAVRALERRAGGLVGRLMRVFVPSLAGYELATFESPGGGPRGS